MSAKAELPPRTETEVDEKGIKYVTYYKREKGKLIKIISKVQVTKVRTRVSKAVMERKKWNKFGKEALSDKDDKITFKGEDFELEMKKRTTNYFVEGVSPLREKLEKSVVKCNFCGQTGHWTLKCPKRKEGDALRNMPASGNTSGSRPSVTSTGKYVPMHMRGLRAAGSDRGSYNRDQYSLRVTNISEDANEDDLRELFRAFGETSRVFLARDRNTQKSRGFAFVSYVRREDAERAIEGLNGYGYDNLILHVEKAKPREQKTNNEKDRYERRKF